jgi:hypothetical protein
MKKNTIFSRQVMMFSETTLNTNIKILWTGFVWWNVFNTLVRTGFKNISLIDFDKVKEHNLLNQGFIDSNLGEYKTDSLKKNINWYLPQQIISELRINTFKMTAESFLDIYWINKDEIVLIAVDSVEARINILTYILENWERKSLNETFFVFVNTSSEVIYNGYFKWNKQSLINMKKELWTFTPRNSTDWVCGEKSSFYLWNLISGLIVSEIRKFYKENKILVTKETMFSIKQNVLDNNYKWFQ